MSAAPHAPELANNAQRGTHCVQRLVRRRYPTHRNCTYILPGRSYPDAAQKWLREKTHGCWCSAWKLLDDGQWRIWRLGRWCKPKPGELRSTEREPPNATSSATEAPHE